MSNKMQLMSFESWDSLDVLASVTNSSSCSSDDGDCFLTESSFDGLSNQQTSASADVIVVSVSGAYYKLTSDTFRRLEQLPWKWTGSVDFNQVERSYSKAQCKYHLHMSPYIFEILLKHVMHGIVPSAGRLSPEDLEEIEPLAVLLNLYVLKRHLNEEQKKTNFVLLCKGPTTYRDNRRQQKKEKRKLKQEREKILQDELFKMQQLASLDGFCNDEKCMIQPSDPNFVKSGNLDSNKKKHVRDIIKGAVRKKSFSLMENCSLEINGRKGIQKREKSNNNKKSVGKNFGFFNL